VEDEQPCAPVRVRISAEVPFEITDVAAIERAALNRIDSAEFSASVEHSAEEIRIEERASVRGDREGALLWLIDSESLLPDLDGVSAEGSEPSVDVLDEADKPTAVPDFAALFELCRCGSQECLECAGYQQQDVHPSGILAICCECSPRSANV
jgi:hypothetical protein